MHLIYKNIILHCVIKLYYSVRKCTIMVIFSVTLSEIYIIPLYLSLAGKGIRILIIIALWTNSADNNLTIFFLFLFFRK